jgi:hypothetical protein
LRFHVVDYLPAPTHHNQPTHHAQRPTSPTSANSKQTANSKQQTANSNQQTAPQITACRAKYAQKMRKQKDK